MKQQIINLNDHNNNFNLIRLLAAYLVLISHSYPIVQGSGSHDFISSIIGVSGGELAVDIFFFISGFLVTGSILRSRTIRSYALARVIRIYPALIMSTFLTVFLLGTILTTAPLIDYFTSTETFKYLTRNSFLLSGVKYYLPGVFETNPYQGAVNGSLWTLPNEIKLYIGLGLTFYLYKIIKNKLEFLNFSYVILAFTLLFLSKIIQSLTIGEGISNGDKLPFLFLLGSCYCIYKDRLVNTINPIGFLLAIVLLIATYIINHEIMKLSILLCIPTIVLYLAYSPKGKVLAFNKLGDYSYGVYIYAFPVQQTLIHAFPSISLIQHMLLSSIIVLFLATLSWHFIEKPSINWVKRNSKKENAKVS